MTDDRLRHRCRNAGHCCQKLPEPVDSARRAFCCRGCYDQFYRKRCVACERSIERTVHNRRLCERRKCGADFRAFPRGLIEQLAIARAYGSARCACGVYRHLFVKKTA
jgi:hypothetical protein